MQISVARQYACVFSHLDILLCVVVAVRMQSGKECKMDRDDRDKISGGNIGVADA